MHEVGRNAVLNANYMMAALQDVYDMAYPGPCMHEFVMTLDRLHRKPAFPRSISPRVCLTTVFIRPQCISH